MAKDLPYVLVPGKISDLFKKIADAKVPDSFSHTFLTDTLGFKSNNDRSLIPLLKSLGFLDSSGKPTSRYREIKNNVSKPLAIGAGIKEAYSAIFDSNENAQNLPAEELKGLVAQISGADKDLSSRIYSTLASLINEASFTAQEAQDQDGDDDEVLVDGGDDSKEPDKKQKNKNSIPPFARPGFSPTSGFHFNIQVHLPNNGTEETYLNIFNAIREAFQ